MAALTRQHDWAATPLGAPEHWEQSLRTAVSICLTTPFVSAVHWGTDLRIIYNDAYAPALAERHPRVLGQPFREVWPEIWDVLGPQIEQVLETGRGFSTENQLLRMERNGRVDDTFWIYSFAPIQGESRKIEGVFVTAIDNTANVLAGQRRDAATSRQQRMFEQAPGFITVLEGPEHRFVLANAAYTRLVGRSDLIGKTIAEALPEAVEQGYLELLDHVFESGETFTSSGSRYVTQDRPGAPADERYVIFVYQPLVDDDGHVTGIFVEGQDVTATDRADAVLRESETRFRNMADNAPVMMWVTDPLGYCTHLNARWYEFTGQAPGSGEAYGWLDAVHPEDRLAAEATFVAANAERRDYQVEFRLRRADGIYRWTIDKAAARFGADGEYLGYVGSVIDIDERREAEQTLALSQEQLRLATDIGEIGEWDVDHITGAMFWPPRVKAMFGISPDVPVTLDDFHDGVHPDDREKTRAAYEAASDPDLRAFYDVEYRTIGKEDGALRWVAAKGRGLFDADGACFRVIGTAIDVTARKADEEKLRELNEKLESRVAERTAELEASQEALRQAQKMEAVGQLTGGLAHDFNNLLTGISGSLELIQLRIAQGRTGDVERYVQAAQGASNRAAALTHRLLAFSRRQTLAPKATDVVQLITGMEELVRRTVGPAVEIETINSAGLWPSLIDPSQLENAVLNLCLNARDAMPDGGKITIETANRWMDRTAADQRGMEPGQYISLCVSDTGTGMPPYVVAKAFDPFFTTKPIGMGTGLGLSMIYGFAKQSGGSVAIYSEAGKGTMVCIYLPRHHGDASENHMIAKTGEPPRAEAGETVLVIDDEPTVRMLVGEVLTDLGYTAIEAADGPAGLKVLNSDLRIDLLVTDVGLPGGMNGRQVADAARTARPDLKVLFITGYAENAVLSHGHLDAGMHVVTKPFAIDTLAARIRELIEG
ncbi:MAG TPA: PAS domain S-box protein [Sphingomicrobium sp.]